MSISCPDYFSDLLCCEESNSVLSCGGGFEPEYSSDFESKPQEVEESIAGLLEEERDLAGISSRSAFQSVDPSVRTEFVAWILKVQRYYGFQPLTAYLSVHYFDRFLQSYHLPKMNGWQEQLLSVACLSLAAKMEEPLVPSLLDINQVDGAKFIFEPRTLLRMELLVLRVLDWRLRSISPFCYIRFFASKIDETGTYIDFLASKAREIILLAIQENSFVEHMPSSIAAAAVLSAASDEPKFSSITAHHASSWCDGLHQENIMSCQQLISKIRHPKIYPQLPAMSQSSESSSSTFKRRKLNNDSQGKGEN